MISYCERGRFPHPYILLVSVPTNKSFIIRQLIKAIIMFYLNTIPFKFCSEKYKFFSPLKYSFFYAREYCLFIYKLYYKLIKVYFASLSKIYNNLCHTQAVLSARKGHIHRYTVIENIFYSYLRRFHDVDC